MKVIHIHLQCAGFLPVALSNTHGIRMLMEIVSVAGCDGLFMSPDIETKGIQGILGQLSLKITECSNLHYHFLSSIFSVLNVEQHVAGT